MPVRAGRARERIRHASALLQRLLRRNLSLPHLAVPLRHVHGPRRVLPGAHSACWSRATAWPPPAFCPLFLVLRWSLQVPNAPYYDAAGVPMPWAPGAQAQPSVPFNDWAHTSFGPTPDLVVATISLCPGAPFLPTKQSNKARRPMAQTTRHTPPHTHRRTVPPQVVIFLASLKARQHARRPRRATRPLWIGG